ncbi:MAG: single-stranded-DNA-specific exonuclease RecJ [Chloroflexi bacterium]|nr:single-stranded-DNA-specific exonuclease RecJ [Chloroflexota bacterium]
MPNSHKTDWVVVPNAPKDFFAALNGVHPLAAQVLWARGLRDVDGVQAFLADDPCEVDPLGLRDMPLAVERIVRAIGSGETIAIYGDYDCDGVTACALLQEVLAALGANCCIYIPDRFEEGYGLNAGALDKLKADGVGLAITVDCGARAIAEAQHARDIGLDLIVTDHHELGGGVPGAYAVINPKRADCPYPFKQLAGVGVAYRLAQCLLRAAPRSVTRSGAGGEEMSDAEYEQSLLDLVAVGTVADVVPLLGENRWLVREGLRRINTQPRLGMRFLARAARVSQGAITAQTIGFTLAPRLNAAGRLDTARNAFDLLTATDESTASELALKLDARNTQRQKVTAEAVHLAEQAARDGGAPDGGAPGQMPALLFAVLEDQNEDHDTRFSGVIGLAAARMVERHYRPAVVVAVHEGQARGSCRSVNGFNITAVLDRCGDLLGRYGGHAAAAGFSTSAASLALLQQRLLDIATVEQPSGGWTRVIQADAEVNLYKLNWQSYEQLAQLEPHGQGNPRPVFVARGAVVHSVKRMGKVQGPSAGQPSASQPPHMQLRLKDARGGTWEAVGWRMGERAAELSAGAKIDLAFQLDVNEWNGERRLQLTILDFRV